MGKKGGGMLKLCVIEQEGRQDGGLQKLQKSEG